MKQNSLEVELFVILFTYSTLPRLVALAIILESFAIFVGYCSFFHAMSPSRLRGLVRDLFKRIRFTSGLSRVIRLSIIRIRRKVVLSSFAT